jgi:hypothetical protein
VAVVAARASEPLPGSVKRVGADHARRRRTWATTRLLQLVAAEEDGGQHADAVVGADARPKSCPWRAAGLGDQQRRGLVEPQTRQSLWDVHHVEAELTGLAEQLAHHAGRLGLDVLVVRQDLALHEVERGAIERALVLGEALRRRDRVVGREAEQEAAAGGERGGSDIELADLGNHRSSVIKVDTTRGRGWARARVRLTGASPLGS